MIGSGIERLVALRVSDVMSKEVIAVTLDQTLPQAALILAEHGISAAPVVDVEGVCVGMISSSNFIRCAMQFAKSGAQAPEEDVLRRCLVEKPLSESEETTTSQELNRIEIEQPQTNVSFYMYDAVQTVGIDVSLVVAARMMCETHHHHLPVIDSAGKPIGMLSTLDIASAMVKMVDEVSGVL